jgi:hypothetical protein
MLAQARPSSVLLFLRAMRKAFKAQPAPAMNAIAHQHAEACVRPSRSEKARARLNAASRYRVLLRSGASEAHFSRNPGQSATKLLNHWCCGTAALWLRCG